MKRSDDSSKKMGAKLGFIDNSWFGFLLGLLIPILGALFFYIFLIEENSWGKFSDAMANPIILSPLIRLGAIFNLLLFFIFIWTKKDLAARGVIFSTFIYGGLVIYLIYFR